MRVWWVLGLLVVGTASAGCSGGGPAASGQDAGAATPQANETSASITGIVLDGEGLPISGARVGIRETGASQTTDEQGRFTFNGLEEGAYTLIIERLGFEAAAQVVPVSTGQVAEIEITLVPIKILVPHTELVQYSVKYTLGLSTLDTTTTRYGVNLTTCGPCTFTFHLADIPDFIAFELDWTRTLSPVAGGADQMYHILRAGTPFEEGTDIGTGTSGLPFKFIHDRDAITDAGADKDGDGLVGFSGSAYCWGDPPWPCVDQRIDAYLTAFYDYEEVPEEYTAVPEDA